MKKRTVGALILCMITLVLMNQCASRTTGVEYAEDFYEQGLTWFEKGEYDRAIDAFSKALGMSPKAKENQYIFFYRGMCHHMNRDYQRAIYDFGRALELTRPKDKAQLFKIYKSLGDAWLYSKGYERAHNNYTEALRLVKKHEQLYLVYHNRGWACEHAAAHDQAISDFTESLEIEPQYAPAFFGRAHAWLSKGDAQRALLDAKEALALDPHKRDYDDLVFRIRRVLKGRLSDG